LLWLFYLPELASNSILPISASQVTRIIGVSHLCPTLCPFLNQIICYFTTELYELFINFGYQPLIRYITCQLFSWSVSCCFILLIICFAMQNAVLSTTEANHISSIH
jgi:hypothetical protein